MGARIRRALSSVLRPSPLRDLLHERDGTFADERDRHRMGAHALARDATGGVGGAEEGRRTKPAVSVLRCPLFATVQLILLLSVVSPATGGDAQPDDLDRIWNEHMIEGKAALIILDNSSEATQELGTISRLPDGRLKASHVSAIVVRRVGKGIWTNGGWILRGGLAGEVQLGSVTFELFGKEVIRRIPYFPFPFHPRSPAQEWMRVLSRSS